MHLYRYDLPLYGYDLPKREQDQFSQIERKRDSRHRPSVSGGREQCGGSAVEHIFR